MKFKEYIVMALRDLWRRKGRTILTSLGIMIGTLLIVAMVGLGLGLKNFMSAMVNDQDTARSIYVQPFVYLTDEEMTDPDKIKDSESYVHKIEDSTIKDMKNIKGVESVIGDIYGSADRIKINNKEYEGSLNYIGYNYGANIYPQYKIDAVRTEKDDQLLKPLAEGSEISSEEGQVLIGEKILKAIKIDPKDIVGKEIEIIINNADGIDITPVSKNMKVVGVIDENFENSQSIVMTAKDAAQIKGYSTLKTNYFENSGYDEVTVVANEVGDVEKVTKQLKKLDYMYTSNLDTAKSMEKILNGINSAFAVLGVIVLIVSAIGIVNTMTMAVMERTKNIGIMKSVGADSSAIRTIFLVQSSLIGVIGGVVGIMLGKGVNSLAELLINSKLSSEGMSIVISVGLPWYIILAIFIFSIVISLLSGIYPAIKASKLDPIEALRR